MRPSEFVFGAERERVLRRIRETIVSGYKGKRATIIRLVGFSGVGKTRMVFEALNTDELRNLVLYAESPEKLPSSRFNEVARNETIEAIFVVDECPHDEYVRLAKEAEGVEAE